MDSIILRDDDCVEYELYQIVIQNRTQLQIISGSDGIHLNEHDARELAEHLITWADNQGE